MGQQTQRGMKQTKMYICTLEEFILVDVVTLLYMCGGTYAGPSIFPRWLPSRPPNTPNYPSYPNLAL